VQAAPDETSRASAARRLGLLTPVAKAWCSDVAVEVASLAVQVHGGLGYIDECEVSQLYRDARIGPIFEGTNYLQAQDLLLRKIIRDGGQAFEELLADMEGAARGLGTAGAHETLARQLLVECAELRGAARHLVRALVADQELARCSAYPFLQWLGVVTGAWQWALSMAAADAAVPAYLGRALSDCGAFYAAQILPRARSHAVIVASGAEAVLRAELEEI
jgi:3-(methylthio)propanoyl-CoA dehydrogenase